MDGIGREMANHGGWSAGQEAVQPKPKAATFFLFEKLFLVADPLAPWQPNLPAEGATLPALAIYGLGHEAPPPSLGRFGTLRCVSYH